MTEAEWLCSDSLSSLYDEATLRFSDRRLRRIACAVVRYLWLHLEESGRTLVEVAERFADRRASHRELEKAWEPANTAFDRRADPLRDPRHSQQPPAPPPDLDEYPGTLALFLACCLSATYLHDFWYSILTAFDCVSSWYGLKTLEQPLQVAACDILRDVVPCPSLPAPMVDPAWLAWNRGLVRAMAEEIYSGRHFEQMPILADALEEAGCTDRMILQHCRQPRVHVRGCWLLDLLLGYELEIPGGGIVLCEHCPPSSFTLRRAIEIEGDYPQWNNLPATVRLSLRVEPWAGPGSVICRIEEAVRQDTPHKVAIVAGLWSRLQEGLNQDPEEDGPFGQILLSVTGNSQTGSSGDGFATAARAALDQAVTRGEWIRNAEGAE
jgi:hypothetical protein